jgi:steroid delta-isomerase-like uncharacterized protein
MEATAAQLGTGVERAFLEDFDARYLVAWNTHDVEAILALVAEDVVWDDPALPKTFIGREGVRHFVEATFKSFPDLLIETPEPPYPSTARPKVLAPYRLTATMLGDWEPLGIAATGARVSFDGIDQWEFRDGLLARYNTTYDSLDVARQMGVLPPLGSFSDRLGKRLQHLQARFQRRKAS